MTEQNGVPGAGLRAKATGPAMRTGHTSGWDVLESSGFSSCLMLPVMTKLNKDSTPIPPAPQQIIDVNKSEARPPQKIERGPPRLACGLEHGPLGLEQRQPGALPWEEGSQIPRLPQVRELRSLGEASPQQACILQNCWGSPKVTPCPVDTTGI